MCIRDSVTRGTPAAKAAKNVTSTVPVVMAASGDPLGTGLVTSLSRPQENCNVARLRVDTRKWAAARLAPKKYSDHITHDVKGGGINFQPQILIQCSSDEGEGFIDVRAAPEAAGGAPQQGNGDIVPGALTGEPAKANWRKLR